MIARKRLLLASLVASIGWCCVPASSGFAAIEPGIEFTGPWVGRHLWYGTLGYEFHVVRDTQVEALGLYVGSGVPADVGLWTDGGSLLAQVNVQDGDPIVGHFQYHSLASPILLPAGQDYVVGGNSRDWYLSDTVGFTVNPDIQFVGSRVGPYLGGFQYPAGSDSLIGYFGGNVLLDRPAVPEPCTLLVWTGLGATALVIARKRRKQVA